MLPTHTTIYKMIGETPLEAIERFRVDASISSTVPLAYAGRLDPMAEGKLLVLIGEECKNQKAYHELDKEYVVEILLDVGSDSGDVLGIVEAGSVVSRPTTEEIKNVLRGVVGSITLPYPVFSSKTVRGKPLFLWQLEGRISEIEIPTKTSRIYSVTLLNTRSVTTEALVVGTLSKIERVTPVTDDSKRLGADFRRDAVRASWNELLERNGGRSFTIFELRVIASSGTYMRSLATYIGEKLGTRCLAHAIARTEIGSYQPLLGKFGFWKKRYGVLQKNTIRG